MTIPKNESIWEQVFDSRNELRFIITSSSRVRDYYYLYEISSGKATRLGKARTPPELKAKFAVDERMCSG